MTGEVLGATIALPIRIGLFFLQPGKPMQGVAALLVQPFVYGGVQPNRDIRYLHLGLGFSLAAGWEQRLGPVEVFPRFGLTTALSYRLQGNTPGRLDLMFKGLIGVSVAIPAGEGTKFLAGFDAHIGPDNMYVVYIGVGF